jgi:hypothetical protein
VKGTATTSDLPFGIQTELRHMREIQRTLKGGLADQLHQGQVFAPRASLDARGTLDASLGAFDAFQVDQEKTLESIRSLVEGFGFTAASDYFAESPAFADITTGVGKGLSDTLAKTAGAVGYGSLSKTVEEASGILAGSVAGGLKPLGVDPDFVRDASSITFGHSRQTRDLLGEDVLDALGISGQEWGERLEKLAQGLAPTHSIRATNIAPELDGITGSGEFDFEKASGGALFGMQGITYGPGTSDWFDSSGFLLSQRNGIGELSSLISGSIVDQAQIESLSRAAVSLSGTLAPALPGMTRQIFDGNIDLWAQGVVTGDTAFATGLELSSRFGGRVGKGLPALDVAKFGLRGFDHSPVQGIISSFEPRMVRAFTGALGTESDFAHGVVNGSAWAEMAGLARDPRWSELFADTETALELPANESVEKATEDDDDAHPATIGVAERLRQMGLWLPAATKREAAFCINFLVSLDAVSEAMEAGDPRKVFFALMSLAALVLTWPGGSRDGG